VLSAPGATPALRTLLPRRLQLLDPEQAQALRALEICPQGMALAERLARDVARHGGAALLMDYGQAGPYSSSLQAIRRHRLAGLLEAPGLADLSAWVDFQALRSASTHG
jgi:NADH dehydrogenase [ubiquinone] 1 alpha subcomplex assembly factor 7